MTRDLVRAKDQSFINTCKDQISHSRTLSKDNAVRQGDIVVHLELAEGHCRPKGRTFKDIGVQFDVSQGHCCPCLQHRICVEPPLDHFGSFLSHGLY
jgi:hypothetical protein